ncbi:glycosyl hydrolase family 28-related protein [Sphingomonas sp. GM_Shp_2]|uniref:glycosyl hydrolase family 28-related protein n=1 Tax=Sphingomonas sp. GM_Shp_2 TaxID=2937380 RepID=UPI00226A3CB2|nr:glycosyl hydrolase family 28-related protein [Sphingomonas sp. GM_Shp_2]
MVFAVDRRTLLAVVTSAMGPLLAQSSTAKAKVEGGTWRFYRSGSAQPAPVYTEADRTIMAAAEIVPDKQGRLPKMYLDPAIEYRAVLSDARGRTLATLDPVPVVGAGLRRGAAEGGARIVVSGAIGDGGFHPLSERFSSLAEAQAVFPAASALTDSICGAAIQSAINRAVQRGKALQGGASVFLPHGRYPLSRSLVLPDGVSLEGEGRDRTFIDNQNSPLAMPLVVNDPAGIARISLRGLSLHGGTHGVRIQVASYVEGLLIEGVSFQLQTDKNFECNKLLQMATFRDCAFGIAPFGVYVAAWTANVVSFEGCSFENHSQTHLHLRGAEGVTVTGGRFEGGGVFDPARATIDIESAAAVSFKGVYFENTHAVLLRERYSRDGISFSDCHFTGAPGPSGPPSLVAYRFDSDGIVTFGSNDWYLPTRAPARIALHGVNRKLITEGRLYFARSATYHHIRSEPVVLRQGERRDLLAIRREGSGPALTLSGSLVVEVRAREGTRTRYQYAVTAVAGESETSLRVEPLDLGAPALEVRPDENGGMVAWLVAAISPIELQWTFEGSVKGVRADESALLAIDLSRLPKRG